MHLRLRDIRKVQNLTQSELAMKVGVSERKLAGWERGETNITLEDAVSCADALGCTPNDLCDWYATHPRERPRAQDPAHEELARCYDRCTPERRGRILMDAREKALLSQEYSERAADAAQGA